MTARTIEAMAARLLPMTEAAPWGSGWAEILIGMSKGDLLSEITSHRDRDHDRAQALALVLTPALALAQPRSCQQEPGERAESHHQWPGTWEAEMR